MILSARELQKYGGFLAIRSSFTTRYSSMLQKQTDLDPEGVEFDGHGDFGITYVFLLDLANFVSWEEDSRGSR